MLRLLDAVEQDQAYSQRNLGSELGLVKAVSSRFEAVTQAFDARLVTDVARATCEAAMVSRLVCNGDLPTPISGPVLGRKVRVTTDVESVAAA
jgi:hypothetical protein